MRRHTERALRSTLVAALLSVLPGTPAEAADGTPPHDEPWLVAIRAMDQAVSQGDVHAAMTSRREAYQTALGSRRWDALADVGDATSRLANTPGVTGQMKADARRAYLEALFRARRQGSLEGVLRVAEAFAALGDREVARQGVVIANVLAARSPAPETRERLRALQERLAADTRTPFRTGAAHTGYPWR